MPRWPASEAADREPCAAGFRVGADEAAVDTVVTFGAGHFYISPVRQGRARVRRRSRRLQLLRAARQPADGRGSVASGWRCSRRSARVRLLRSLGRHHGHDDGRHPDHRPDAARTACISTAAGATAASRRRRHPAGASPTRSPRTSRTRSTRPSRLDRFAPGIVIDEKGQGAHAQPALRRQHADPLPLLRSARRRANSPIGATATAQRARPQLDATRRRGSPMSTTADNPAGDAPRDLAASRGCRAWLGRDAQHADPRDLERRLRARRRPAPCDGASRHERRRVTSAPRQPAAVDRPRAPSASASTAALQWPLPATRSPRRCSPTASRLVGRSFKYHRPRGIVVGRHRGAERAGRRCAQARRREPNTRATMSSSRRPEPSIARTAGPRSPSISARSTQLAGRCPRAGFYYKTFMGPVSAAGALRAASSAAPPGSAAPASRPIPTATRGRTPSATCSWSAPARPGSGGARRRPQRARASSSPSENARLGGTASWSERDDRRHAGRDWAAARRATRGAATNVRCLRAPRSSATTTAMSSARSSAYRSSARSPARGEPRQRALAHPRRRVVLATGAIERPLVFPGNDRPGVMLAGAAAPMPTAMACAGRQAPSSSPTTMAPTARRATCSRRRRGRARSSTRAPTSPARAAAARSRHAIIAGAVVERGTDGGKAVSRRRSRLRRADGRPATSLECDCCAGLGRLGSRSSICQPGAAASRAGTTRSQAFLPPEPRRGWIGRRRRRRPLLDSPRRWRDGAPRHRATGARRRRASPPTVAASELADEPCRPLWEIPAEGKAFVDLQNDVTAADVALAAREGYISVEHLKRYTTLGMATDQGKTSQHARPRHLAERAACRSPGRHDALPPAVHAGHARRAGRAAARRDLQPTPLRRCTTGTSSRAPMFVEAGLWQRPQCLRAAGESGSSRPSPRGARGARERRHRRRSTLGKIDVQGAGCRDSSTASTPTPSRRCRSARRATG